MKTWNSYGSEHSANLVMIGKFADSASAEEAKEAIDTITDFLTSGEAVEGSHGRYPDGLMSILEKYRFYSLSPEEIEQFRMEISSKVEGEQVVVTTDEADVSAFLKLMVDKGARVEVFSAHVHPDPNGRDTAGED